MGYSFFSMFTTMKNNAWFLSILVLAVLFASCKKDMDKPTIVSTTSELAIKVKVLKYRDADLPLVLQQSKYDTVLSIAWDSLAFPNLFQQYLGCGYEIKTLPVGNRENVTFPVIDVQKLKLAANITNIHTFSLPATSDRSFAYDNFDKYNANAHIATKIASSNVAVNLEPFSQQAKHTMETVFSPNTINQNNSIFGEARIYVHAQRHRLQNNSYINKKIAENYLDSTFVDKIYNAVPNTWMKEYGHFLLRDFYSGAKVTILYAATSTSHQVSSDIENQMNMSIRNTYGSSSNAGFGIGKKYTNNAPLSPEIKNLSLAVRAVGSNAGPIGYFDGPYNFEEIDINLSDWLQQTDEETTHTITFVANKGLLPIQDIVLEQNFKRTTNYYGQQKALCEPRLVFVYNPQHLASGTNVNVYLKTRFSDFIFLREVADVSHTTITQELNKLQENMSKYYNGIGIDVFECTSDAMSIISKNAFNDITSDGNHNSQILDEPKFKKYINPRNGLTYLLCPEKKIAFTIYDDFILDTYGIREWVNQMPTIGINCYDFYLYTVFGL